MEITYYNCIDTDWRKKAIEHLCSSARKYKLDVRNCNLNVNTLAVTPVAARNYGHRISMDSPTTYTVFNPPGDGSCFYR